MSDQIRQAQALYAALAEKYDAETRYITGIRKAAIAALQLREGETVVDAGCGTGWCLPFLAAGVGDTGKVIGFEPSADMLAVAKNRVQREALMNVTLVQASGDTVPLPHAPDAILFSYTHDLIRSRDSLEHVFSQARAGTRIIAASTKLFPKWFFPGNWYLRHTHRMTITNFESFDRPWTRLAEYCEPTSVRVRVTVPGSRYIFSGVLKK